MLNAAHFLYFNSFSLFSDCDCSFVCRSSFVVRRSYANLSISRKNPIGFGIWNTPIESTWIIRSEFLFQNRFFFWIETTWSESEHCNRDVIHSHKNINPFSSLRYSCISFIYLYQVQLKSFNLQSMFKRKCIPRELEIDENGNTFYSEA